MPDFVHELRVRYGECDPQGIVFNPNYLAYFDHTVTELWRASAIGSWEAMVERGVDVVVGEANVRFRAPARFDDLIASTRGVAKFGTTSADARARDPPRRRAAGRGLAAPGLRRREDLARRRRSRTGSARRWASTRPEAADSGQRSLRIRSSSTAATATPTAIPACAPRSTLERAAPPAPGAAAGPGGCAAARAA